MKKLFVLLVLAVIVTLGVLFLLKRDGPRPTGPRVYVLFDESHDLAAGSTVMLKDVVIGRVESVETERGRVRVAVRLDGAHARSLSSASTFKPEGWTESRLGAHVIDPEAPPIEPGATVEGCDSMLELWFMEGQYKAQAMMKDVERAVEDIDVSALSTRLKDDLRDLSRELGELGAGTGEKARDSYAKLKPEVDRLVRELEELGKSKEAQELKRKFDELLSKTRT